MYQPPSSLLQHVKSKPMGHKENLEQKLANQNYHFPLRPVHFYFMPAVHSHRWNPR